jgi:hypothetical protein
MEITTNLVITGRLMRMIVLKLLKIFNDSKRLVAFQYNSGQESFLSRVREVIINLLTELKRDAKV